MNSHLKRAFQDFKGNKFLHITTIFTTALSILLVSAFGLFYLNVGDIIQTWTKGTRIFVYLDTAFPSDQAEGLKKKISGIKGIDTVVFISKDEALASLKTALKHQVSLFDNLSSNPLPDAFEIVLLPAAQSLSAIEGIVSEVNLLPHISDIEYGQKWLQKFLRIFKFFKLVGLILGVTFLTVTTFIIANTIRIALYSRKDEIEILRLVGASDPFISTPLYMEGIIEGALGGGIGLLTLYIPFQLISSGLEQHFPLNAISIRFFSLSDFLIILLSSVIAGWIGCFISLRHYLKSA